MNVTLPATTLPAKLPGEAVTVLFDFSSETTAVSVATTTSALYTPVHADAAPSAMISGGATVSGTNPAQVLQRIAGGLADNDYLILCSATAANGDTLICPAILPVRNAKTAS